MGDTTYLMQAAAVNLNVRINGIYLSTTAVNALRFLFSSGNIASGVVRMYGVAK